MVLQKEHRQRKLGRNQLAGEESDAQVSAKRQKRSADTYPPDAWDNLSKITLTRSIDRIRSSNKREQAPAGRQSAGDGTTTTEYAALPSTEAAMNQSNSRTSKRQRDSGLAGSSFTGRTSTTGPYDPQFEQLLIDHGVYPDGFRTSSGAKPPKPQNMEDICRKFSQPRPFLSLSQFSESAFEDFQGKNHAASNELNMMTTMFPTIRGNTGNKFHSEADKLFNNLAKFGPGIADAKPDDYDGARPEEIDLAVRRDLNGYIIP
ncbi:hypothetical protein LTR53_014869 [Teratosphaeriaceae sp. CCFEE 6253]|nr:hypothetical protein LTR53_014869 [Teratosphaeriaceae sp. CCFEE 6253]